MRCATVRATFATRANANAATHARTWAPAFTQLSSVTPTFPGPSVAVRGYHNLGPGMGDKVITKEQAARFMTTDKVTNHVGSNHREKIYHWIKKTGDVALRQIVDEFKYEENLGSRQLLWQTLVWLWYRHYLRVVVNPKDKSKDIWSIDERVWSKSFLVPEEEKQWIADGKPVDENGKPKKLMTKEDAQLAHNLRMLQVKPQRYEGWPKKQRPKKGTPERELWRKKSGFVEKVPGDINTGKHPRINQSKNYGFPDPVDDYVDPCPRFPKGGPKIYVGPNREEHGIMPRYVKELPLSYNPL